LDLREGPLTGRNLAASSVNTFQQALPWILISAPNQAVLQIHLERERESRKLEPGNPQSLLVER